MRTSVTAHQRLKRLPSLTRRSDNQAFYKLYFRLVFCLYSAVVPTLYASTLQNIQTLPFVLIGTITGSQPLALLEVTDKKLLMLGQNERFSHFTVISIQSNNITLMDKKQLYTLHLQQRTALPSPSPSHSSEQLSGRSNDLPINITIKRRLLKHIGHHIQQWLNAISLKPEMTDGRISGYRIESIKNIPLSSAIGLQQGDIIRAVNGVYVGQAEQFAQIINQLSKNNDIHIKIDRGHKLNTLHFNVQD